ncbi:MAG: hypothetical protein MUO36_00830, partial [Candidatus Hadarchaeum sp.]|nr:hypothetical protein [Candidatus Hadarchaeum sp.]
MKKIAAAYLIAILLLSSTQLLLYRVAVPAVIDIPHAAIEAGVSGNGSSGYNWHWDSPGGDYVQGVAISADGSYVVARTFSGKIYLFNKSS